MKNRKHSEVARKLAGDAAAAAWDCFGDSQDLPGPHVAYSFVYQLAYDDETAELPSLTGREFKAFALEYRRQIENRRV